MSEGRAFSERRQAAVKRPKRHKANEVFGLCAAGDERAMGFGVSGRVRAT
jgi:hypothetical protein